MKSRYERLRFLLVFTTAHLGSLQCRQQLFPTRIRDIEMKKLLLFVTALCLSSLSFAQVMVATLQHGDSLRVFYYADAFVDAYNAAVPGDVISLSAGSFTPCNIDKDSLTIRGAGIDKTFVEGLLLGAAINSPIRTFTMEGINGSYCNLYRNMEVHFRNVKFGSGYSDANNNRSTGEFINCIISGFHPNSTSTLTLINSIIISVTQNSKSSFINCIVEGNIFAHLTNTSFINSILVYYHSYHDGYSALPQTALAQNCVGVKNSSSYLQSIFDQCVNQNSVLAPTSIFPNFSMDNLNPERYILSDSAQAQYLGNDSTQVGLYGGFMPYKSTLTYPVISRLNVARQTTADGRLSVDIQVGYRQESEDNE